MPKLVIDIESAGKNLEDFDQISQDYFRQWAKTASAKADDLDFELQKIEEGFSLSPLTAEVVCIGMLNPETDKGMVYYRSGNERKEFEENNIKFSSMSEPEMLKNFWEQAKFYDEFITFNGRGFDIPFLMIRSAIHKIKPSKNLLSNRYLNSQFAGAKHIDLQDQFQFYGATWGKRGYNLHMFCNAFGIKSPKNEGVSGSHVKEMFDRGEFERIARYNADDIHATAALYKYWQKYMNV
ncbi:hypothetical protein A3H55_03335 [Candidatus Kuenenbacteria bacterium RIFCSPLOWO2_02_FULL_42_16]|uniref:Predicted 3'-5' exonuclease PolB-like domain-containing protein n=1 Tax=Candidatus Kuenenbacteria bacterium RIFCSPLOWO2_02_FULL_42_16 TaxID=1798564 RepID=A0A1F6FZZ1_9BACT|nr:MAG: hypothetical protein A3H55_03335 [Candidatus Kuenenbacteria bacterium RIFCSPLOWO2_02_FULL_42_16]